MAFLEAAFFRVAFLEAAFLRAAFFRVAFLEAAFLRAAFFRVAFFEAAFLRAAFFRVAFLEAAFLRAAFFRVAFLRVALLAVALRRAAVFFRVTLRRATFFLRTRVRAAVFFRVAFFRVLFAFFFMSDSAFRLEDRFEGCRSGAARNAPRVTRETLSSESATGQLPRRRQPRTAIVLTRPSSPRFRVPTDPIVPVSPDSAPVNFRLSPNCRRHRPGLRTDASERHLPDANDRGGPSHAAQRAP